MDPVSTPLADQYLQYCAQNGYCINVNQVASPSIFLTEPHSSTISLDLQKQIDTIYTIMKNIDNKELRPYFGFPGTYLGCTTQCSDLKLALFATNLLLNNGIKVDDKINAKHTALEQIIEYEERLPVITLLLEKGANVPKGPSLKRASQANLEVALNKGSTKKDQKEPTQF